MLNPSAVAFNKVALEFCPKATDAFPEAKLLVPRAVAAMPVALLIDPREVALSALATAWRPNAIELKPVALDASPTATLKFVAVAPLPPPMAMEKASTVEAKDDPGPRAEVSLTTPLCIAVPAITNVDSSPKVRPTATAVIVFMPLDGPLLFFLRASSLATTQLPREQFHTTEKILFIIVFGARQPPERNY
nr:hypothetical protein [Pseudomonas fragi]